MDAISIAMSGMQAASVRLDAAASNVANMRTTGALPSANGTSTGPAPYSALRVDTVEISGGGTAANVSTASPPYTASYDPTASFADGNGMVAAPNVDIVNETMQQLTAKYQFAASAAVMRAASDMNKTILDTTA
jgi:flagellar basal-body rod protein FlgC